MIVTPLVTVGGSCRISALRELTDGVRPVGWGSLTESPPMVLGGSRMARLATALLVTLLALVLATPVQAITGGTLDGDAHPEVGAVIAIYEPISEEPIVWCSGTLVAPTLFLTAAHCLEDDPDLTIVGVTFDPVPVDPETGAVV